MTLGDCLARMGFTYLKDELEDKLDDELDDDNDGNDNDGNDNDGRDNDNTSDNDNDVELVELFSSISMFSDW